MRLPVAMGFLISFQPMRRKWESTEHYKNYCFFLILRWKFGTSFGNSFAGHQLLSWAAAFWTRESLVAEVLQSQRLVRTWASTKTLRPVATWWVLEASKVNMKLGSWVGGELGWSWMNNSSMHVGEFRCLFFWGGTDFQAQRCVFIPRLKWLRPRMYDPFMYSHF